MTRRRWADWDTEQPLIRLLHRLRLAGAQVVRINLAAEEVHADLGAGEVPVVAGDLRLREDGTVAATETTPEASPPRGPCRVPAGGVRSSPTSEDALTRTDRVPPTSPGDKPERA